jgi:phage-related protein
MLKTVYFDAHHRHKWQCFRIRLVDKGNEVHLIIYFSYQKNSMTLLQQPMQNIMVGMIKLLNLHKLQ